MNQSFLNTMVLLLMVSGGLKLESLFGNDALPAEGNSLEASAYAKEVEKIAEDHKTSRQAAASKLNNQFDAALKRVPKAKMSAEQKLRAQEVLRAEQKRFQEHGVIPFSQALCSSSVKYLQEFNKCDLLAQNKFAELILKLDDRLTEAELTKLKQLGDGLLKPVVVARWSHQTGANPRGTVTLLSNGRIGAADSPNHWILLTTGRIQFRWPNAAAPGGVWIDDSVLSPDGLEFKGKNQHNSAALGTLILP
ncbi:MAG: hypothetical protein KDA89_04235 [Planctomycetaceae bacterium]|nr:hypothetical protein [Planctomycetaceae bacterium]